MSKAMKRYIKEVQVPEGSLGPTITSWVFLTPGAIVGYTLILYEQSTYDIVCGIITTLLTVSTISIFTTLYFKERKVIYKKVSR